MQLDKAVVAYFYSVDLTPATQADYRQKLGVFIRWAKGHTCELHPTLTREVADLDTFHLREFIDSLRGTTVDKRPTRIHKPIGSYTLRGYANVVKSFANWCVNEGMLDRQVAERFTLPKREAKVVQVFSLEHVMVLIRACDERYNPRYTWLTERDKSIVYILLDTGIRRAELCKLTLGDVRFDKSDPHILIHGKNRKEREVGLGQECRKQLYRYIHRFRPTCDHDTVFVGRDGNPLAVPGLNSVIRQLRERVDLPSVRVSPHTFRHTFSYNYLKSGGDVMKLSRLLGHGSLGITELYLASFDSREARKGPSVLDELTRRKGAG